MVLPIEFTSDDQIPIYQQLRYQLSYLITSGRLNEGTRLPPVRELADQCGVNPGTVAQAYKELQQDGLLISHTGRGTFVSNTIPNLADTAQRQDLLTETLDQACQRALALGFTEREIRQRFSVLMSRPDLQPTVAFVGPTQAIARKYSGRLEVHLGNGVKAVPLTQSELEARDPYALSVFDLVYFVVTFALTAKRTEELLLATGRRCRVLGLNTQVTESTFAALSGLSRTAQACLVTQERYLNTSLNLLINHSPLRRENIVPVFDHDTTEVQEATQKAEVVVYTFGVRDLLNELGVPAAKRCEISFDIGPDSVARLRPILLPGTVENQTNSPEEEASPISQVLHEM